jgi:hypothetical protein
MYNWSTDEQYLKQFPEEYEKWRLLQLINYGLDGEKIELKILKKYWPEIKKEIIDGNKISFFEKFILNNEEYFH